MIISLNATTSKSVQTTDLSGLTHTPAGQQQSDRRQTCCQSPILLKQPPARLTTRSCISRCSTTLWLIVSLASHTLAVISESEGIIKSETTLMSAISLRQLHLCRLMVGWLNVFKRPSPWVNRSVVQLVSVSGGSNKRDSYLANLLWLSRSRNTRWSTSTLSPFRLHQIRRIM